MSALKSQAKVLPFLISSLFSAGAAIADDNASPAQDSVIIVTGTRDAGRRARDSATPIDVVSGADLVATGQSNLLDALRNVLPSINTPAVGYDVGALARTFQLRGLSPSHTLVLVNGKRRHLSASLYADSDPAQGSNAVDLDFIPLAAIDHVEVLRDGAAAQYGSDAIAGVINVILKKTASGTEVSLSDGAYYSGGGQTPQVDFDTGLTLGGDGSLHISGGYRFHDFSNRSGDSTGPETAKVQGDPRSGVASLGFNLQKPLAGGVSAYLFGTVGHRDARAYENPRQPGWFSDAVDAVYPNGFSPLEQISENDYSLTGGAKGRTANGWDWDASVTQGRNEVQLRNIHSINPALLANDNNAQTDFDVGSFSSSELTSNIDVKRKIPLSALAAPLTLALGIEDRYEKFSLGAGEPNSYYLGGSQAFPGFRLSDQANASRNAIAAYIDLDAYLTQDWELGLAARSEHYDDVGGKLTGKLTSRYEISPRLAIRGSVSNGFHAPTLAQQYYSATTVTTGFAQIQLPPGSAGAKLLGAPDLKPETSRNFSVGFVFEPARDTHLTVDAYQISVDDRIIQSASRSGAVVATAIAANGSVIPSDVAASNVSAAFFTNGVDTRTRGVDAVLDFKTDLPHAEFVKWVLNAGYNKTDIRHIHDAPGVLAAAGLSLVDAVQTSNLSTATPHVKASLSANYRHGAWDLTLRESFYSKSSQVQGYAPGPYYTLETNPAWLTDLDTGYRFSKQLKINVGATNLFNKTPNKIPAAVYQNLNYDQYSHVSPYGINGGFYYARLTLSL